MAERGVPSIMEVVLHVFVLMVGVGCFFLTGELPHEHGKWVVAFSIIGLLSVTVAAFMLWMDAADFLYVRKSKNHEQQQQGDSGGTGSSRYR